jgi:hypothetical protein
MRPGRVMDAALLKGFIMCKTWLTDPRSLLKKAPIGLNVR